MFRLLSAGAALWLCTLALSGCAQRCAHCRPGVGGSDLESESPAATVVRRERESLAPNLSEVPSHEEVDRVLARPAAAGGYRVLNADEVQCLAAANAPLAKLYASEGDAAGANAGRYDGQSVSLTKQLTAYRAVDERNKAAGNALELFYRLAEAEAGRDVLDRGIVEVGLMEAHLEQLKGSGLKMPGDPTAIRRQKLDWINRRIQLDAAVVRMQEQLQQLCGLESDPARPLWPDADFHAVVEPVDVEAAVAEGLAHRADVGAVRLLDASLSADTLSAARGGLQPFGAGLGASIAAKRLFGNRYVDAGELETRRKQIAQAKVETERTAVREIREAAWNVENSLRQIAVAKERLALWAQRAADLEAKHRTNGVTVFDLGAARLELCGAESDAVHRVAAWRIAQAKLKQAQGLLAAECGYLPPRCCP